MSIISSKLIVLLGHAPPTIGFSPLRRPAYDLKLASTKWYFLHLCRFYPLPLGKLWKRETNHDYPCVD